MNPNEPTPVAQNSPLHNPLSVMQPGERILCEITRHPVGIFVIFAMNAMLLVVLAVFAFIVAPDVITSISRSAIIGISVLIFILFALLSLGFVYVANNVYWGNRWILTSDSLTQVTQSGMLDKRATQLSLSNLEDVAVEQHGLLPRLFNYGILRVETAGERGKFIFRYCPNPTYYAKQVLDAREKFEQGKTSS